jgi:hypothetical protein
MSKENIFELKIEVSTRIGQQINKWVAGSVVDANLKIDSLQSLNESLKAIL